MNLTKQIKNIINKVVGNSGFWMEYEEADITAIYNRMDDNQ